MKNRFRINAARLILAMAALVPAFAHGGFDHIVRTDDVGREGDIIRFNQYTWYRGEMDYGIWRAGCLALVVTLKAEMRCQSIEGLSAVGEVSNDRIHAGQIERFQVNIQDGIAFGQKMRYGVASRFASAACENDAFGHGGLHLS